MKFKLYVELASRVEDERVLNLFRFPADGVFVTGARWSAKCWSHGRTKRIQSKDRESILSRLGRDGFNELDITCKTGPSKPARRPQFSDAWIYTELSPGNVLWAPVPEEKLKSITDDRKRRNFAVHTNLSEFARPYPTEVQYMLEVETPGDVAGGLVEMQKLSLELVRSAVPRGLEDCGVFGYGCVEGKCRLFGMIRGACARGANLDELGEKFENIYPILIGPKASCEGLAKALGTAEKWPLFEGEESPTYILSIPSDQAVAPFPRKPDVLAPSALDPLVRRWLA